MGYSPQGRKESDTTEQLTISLTACPLKLSLFLLAAIRPCYSQISMANVTKSQDEETYLHERGRDRQTATHTQLHTE